LHYFVTGASGYIGGAIARFLVRGGHTVTALARSDATAARLHAAGLRVHRGDLLDPNGFAPALEAADGVVHTAVGGPRGVTDADAAALDAMVQVLAGRGVPLLLTSGLGVYAGAREPVVDEDTLLTTPTPGQAPRVRLEELALRTEVRGIRPVVIRPGHVYGRGSAGAFTRMQVEYALRHGAGAYVGDGAVPYNTVHIDDLVEVYAAALDRAPAGRRYNVVGHTLTTREVASAVSHAVGAGGRTISLTPEQAIDAWGSLGISLSSAPFVCSLRTVLELKWTPRAPTLPFELVHGSLREPTPR
jgi:nucleoside-diphosphate-sugar epimerase